MTSEKDLIQTYRDGLLKLIDHLMPYAKSAHTGQQVSKYVTKLTTCQKRKHTTTGMDGLWKTMQDVAQVVGELYSGVPGFEKAPFRMFDEDKELTVTYEAVRLRSLLPELPFRGLFEKFDEERARKSFYRSDSQRGGSTGSQTVFRQQLKTLTEIAEVWSKLRTADDLSMRCSNYMLEARSMAKTMPSWYEMELKRELYQCYGNRNLGARMADQYTRSLKKLSKQIDAMMITCGREATPNPQVLDTHIKDYLPWIKHEGQRMEDLYVELVYRLVLRTL